MEGGPHTHEKDAEQTQGKTGEGKYAEMSEEDGLSNILLDLKNKRAWESGPGAIGETINHGGNFERGREVDGFRPSRGNSFSYLPRPYEPQLRNAISWEQTHSRTPNHYLEGSQQHWGQPHQGMFSGPQPLPPQLQPGHSYGFPPRLGNYMHTPSYLQHESSGNHRPGEISLDSLGRPTNMVGAWDNYMRTDLAMQSGLSPSLQPSPHSDAMSLDHLNSRDRGREMRSVGVGSTDMHYSNHGFPKHLQHGMEGGTVPWEHDMGHTMQADQRREQQPYPYGVESGFSNSSGLNSLSAAVGYIDPNERLRAGMSGSALPPSTYAWQQSHPNEGRSSPPQAMAIPQRSPPERRKGKGQKRQPQRQQQQPPQEHAAGQGTYSSLIAMIPIVNPNDLFLSNPVTHALPIEQQSAAVNYIPTSTHTHSRSKPAKYEPSAPVEEDPEKVKRRLEQAKRPRHNGRFVNLSPAFLPISCFKAGTAVPTPENSSVPYRAPGRGTSSTSTHNRNTQSTLSNVSVANNPVLSRENSAGGSVSSTSTTTAGHTPASEQVPTNDNRMHTSEDVSRNTHGNESENISEPET